MYYKRIAVSLILLSLFTVGSVSAAPSVRLNESQTQTKSIDKRVLILESYFAKYNSPLEKEAVNFIEAADKYNLDWKLVAAISGVESTFGKFTPGYKSYNAWGWGVYGTNCLYFKSWKDGIYTVSEGLRSHYFDKGLTNPYDINRVYAASPTWGAKVTYFLNDMEKFQKEFENEYNKTITPNIIAQTAGQSATLKYRSGS